MAYVPLHQVVILVSSNPHKVAEYARHFSTYGITVHRLTKATATDELRARLFAKECYTCMPEGRDPSEEADIVEGKLETERRVHKAFVEDATRLKKAGSEEDVSIGALAHLERVDNFCHLTARIWSKEDGAEVCKEYEYRSEGYVDLRLKDEQGRADGTVFGWDDVFVPLHLERSFHALAVAGFKVSSRDMCLSNLIQDILYYTSKSGRLDLAWRPQHYTRTIDFSKRVDEYLRSIPEYNNEYAQQYGVTLLLSHVMQQGVFFRAAENRRTRHYWFPGLNAGIPFTAKPKDPMHELAFQMHDWGHFSIPDLIYTGDPTPLARRIYILYRLCGEATTLSMGDMVFIDSVFKSGLEYETVKKRRIYPLFQQLERSGIVLSNPDTFEENIHRLLRTSAQYILCGRTDAYHEVLAEAEAKGVEVDHSAVESFAEKYNEYVLADFWWTARNYQEMEAHSREWAAWWDGVQHLRHVPGRTHLQMYSVGEFMAEMRKRGHEFGEDTDHDVLANQVFETLWDLLLRGIFSSKERVDLKDATWNLESSFRRWMMGQLMLFHHYAFVPEAKKYHDRIVQALEKPPATSASELQQCDALRTHYEQFLDLLVERRLMSLDDRRIYAEVYPVVRPCYINYDVKSDVVVRDYILTIMSQKKFALEA
eukprot:TRINITY_DN20583_c0_g1_i1.p1 TRINITY_DN20583_c0_g1~~TRINITY_DN20583_c0_g1_i1.p1  ORF type:complete len:686 (-),score=260.37 TRINITY_DN20583_c0_g1_i1:71-2026(-)